MSNFANSYLKYANHLKKINEAARSAPERLVQEIEESYREQLHMAADKIERSRHDYRIVLLAGPSSSGKTTTATRLCACLTERGIDNTLISLDDFRRMYAGIGGKQPLCDAAVRFLPEKAEREKS